MPSTLEQRDQAPATEAERFAAAWDEFFAAVRRARGRAAREAEPGTLTLAQFQLLAAFEHERELTVGALAEAGRRRPADGDADAGDA